MSQPSISKVADYLIWFLEDQGLSLSSVKAHRSMLSSVFQFKLPALGEDRVLQDLLCSFAIKRPWSSNSTFLGLGCGAVASDVFGV